MTVGSCEFESHSLHEEINCGILVQVRAEASRLIMPSAAENAEYAEIAQLVEHNLAKVRVASSSLVFRSKRSKALGLFFILNILTNYKPQHSVLGLFFFT